MKGPKVPEIQLGLLEQTSRKQFGTGFALLMEYHGRDPYKDYGIFLRSSQPCQGGELRRYRSTHGELCTQPHDERPGDLFNPFPSGRVAAAAFRIFQGPMDPGLLCDLVFSEDSPWKSGFGGLPNVKFYKRPNTDQIEGFILRDTRLVDPTVMVNLLGYLNIAKNHGKRLFEPLLEFGMSPNQALAFTILNNNSLNSVMQTFTYRFPALFSPRRFFEGRPNDLSGGSWGDGCDYNRTYVQDVFSGSPEYSIQWFKDVRKLLGDTTPSREKIFAIAKELFETALEREPELRPEDTRYHYRDHTGKILPYPAIALKINPSLKAFQIEDDTPAKPRGVRRKVSTVEEVQTIQPTQEAA